MAKKKAKIDLAPEIEKLISEQPNWAPMAYDPGDEYHFLDGEKRAEVDAYVAEHDVSVFEALKELDLLWEQQEECTPEEEEDEDGEEFSNDEGRNVRNV